MATVQLNGHPIREESYPAAPRRWRLLGELLIREGLITETQLAAALRAQETTTPDAPVGQILVDQGALPAAVLRVALEHYHKKYRLGDLLVETNAITENQLELALGHHRKTGLRLGDALLQLGFVSEADIKRALCTQLGITFVEPDRLVVDPQLRSLIPRDYAQYHRVLPVCRSGDTLTVAVADPTDGWLADDLQFSTGCPVTLVASTDAVFEQAFTQAYGRRPETDPAARPARLGDARAVLGHRYESSLRALVELRDAHESFLREHEASLETAVEERTRGVARARALAELRGAHEALLAERAERAETLATLGRTHEDTVRRLATLEEEHRWLLEDHEATERHLAEERARVEEWARALGDVEAAHEAACRHADDRRHEVDTLRAEIEGGREALAELRAAHTRLQDEHATLSAQHDQATRELRERCEVSQERQQLAAEQLEAVLRRLRP